VHSRPQTERDTEMRQPKRIIWNSDSAVRRCPAFVLAAFVLAWYVCWPERALAQARAVYQGRRVVANEVIVKLRPTAGAPALSQIYATAAITAVRSLGAGSLVVMRSQRPVSDLMQALAGRTDVEFVEPNTLSRPSGCRTIRSSGTSGACSTRAKRSAASLARPGRTSARRTHGISLLGLGRRCRRRRHGWRLHASRPASQHLDRDGALHSNDWGPDADVPRRVPWV
jgi:hypothetical protein